MIWDYIILGAGSSGCALAHELAKSGAKRVLVLEAGGRDRSPFIKIPAGVLRACAEFDWGYRSSPDPSRGGMTESWVRGRVLGGSSSINGMLYVRGANEDYDRWNTYCGNVGGWSSEEVVALYRELENSDQPGAERGRGGRLHTVTTRHPHPVTRRFVEAAQAAGLEFNPDYNNVRQDGVGYMQRTQRNGLRWSAADAFLKPLLKQNNLELRLNALVERMEVQNGRATGVWFTVDGERHKAQARDIILCAGAINSPKLLMLSGVGPAEELRRHGIAVEIELPSVGRNLKEHPFVRMLYRSKVTTNNLTGGPLQKLEIAAKFAWRREGPIAAGYESAAFLRTRPDELLPDVMLYFAPIGYLGKVGRKAGSLARFPAFMTGVAKMRPDSSGRITLASPSPTDPPRIECELLSEPSDVETLIRGVQEARRIAAQASLAEITAEEISPGRAVDTPGALEDFIRANAEVSSHPIGTCRMGVGPDAVVDPTLLVRGTENLWVADASIMPDHLSANLNAVCIMIGLKLGKHLNARAR